MLVLLSPAKKLDLDSQLKSFPFSEPHFLNEAASLIKVLKTKSKAEVSAMMSLSDKLSELNVERYSLWKKSHSVNNSRPALFTFKGDVYASIGAHDLSEEEVLFAQEHLLILSGLYGALKPLDLIQPYRLEMGTKLETSRGGNLYKFWGNKIVNSINKKKPSTIINLASNEYFKSVNAKELIAPVVTIQFKESRDGAYKMIGIFAKKARGLMARYILQNSILNVQDIKSFKEDDYCFNAELSSENTLVFTR